MFSYSYSKMFTGEKKRNLSVISHSRDINPKENLEIDSLQVVDTRTKNVRIN